MTVRTWITISVAVLVALSVAVAVQFLRPVPAPAIVVRAGDLRLAGGLDRACWPQRSGKLRCTDKDQRLAREETIPGNGSLRVVFAYPAEPKDGFVRIDTVGGKTVLRSEWKPNVRYDLDPGRYVLTAQAGKTGEAFVRYVFALRVT